MIYTNMLFALALDKVVFGQTPGWWSLAGSGLILGSAVFVAVKKGQAEVEPGRGRARDEEAIGRCAEEEMAMLGGEEELELDAGLELSDGEAREDGHKAERGDEADVEVLLRDFPPRSISTSAA